MPTVNAVSPDELRRFLKDLNAEGDQRVITQKRNLLDALVTLFSETSSPTNDTFIQTLNAACKTTECFQFYLSNIDSSSYNENECLALRKDIRDAAIAFERKLVDRYVSQELQTLSESKLNNEETIVTLKSAIGRKKDELEGLRSSESNRILSQEEENNIRKAPRELAEMQKELKTCERMAISLTQQIYARTIGIHSYLDHANPAVLQKVRIEVDRYAPVEVHEAIPPSPTASEEELETLRQEIQEKKHAVEERSELLQRYGSEANAIPQDAPSSEREATMQRIRREAVPLLKTITEREGKLAQLQDEERQLSARREAKQSAQSSPRGSSAESSALSPEGESRSAQQPSEERPIKERWVGIWTKKKEEATPSSSTQSTPVIPEVSSRSRSPEPDLLFVQPMYSSHPKGEETDLTSQPSGSPEPDPILTPQTSQEDIEEEFVEEEAPELTRLPSEFDKTGIPTMVRTQGGYGEFKLCTGRLTSREDIHQLQLTQENDTPVSAAISGTNPHEYNATALVATVLDSKAECLYWNAHYTELRHVQAPNGDVISLTEGLDPNNPADDRKLAIHAVGMAQSYFHDLLTLRTHEKAWIYGDNRALNDKICAVMLLLQSDCKPLKRITVNYYCSSAGKVVADMSSKEKEAFMSRELNSIKGDCKLLKEAFNKAANAMESDGRLHQQSLKRRIWDRLRGAPAPEALKAEDSVIKPKR